MSTQLRVYRADDCDAELGVDGPHLADGLPGDFRPDPSVRVRLGDLLPLVAVAQKQRFVWLKDFLDDEVAISEDLHELLMGLRRPTRPGA